MGPPTKSVEFFATQFDRQIAAAEYALNPFERLALPWFSGSLLDLGCGLGNLSLAAARSGCRVTAIDACANAVADLGARASRDALPVEAHQADLRDWTPDRTYDSVACIGLLMFFEPAVARRALERVQSAVAPGGIAVVNVLVEGTTYLAMFDPAGHHLFGEAELREAFAGWTVLEWQRAEFEAPGGTVKRFVTLVAKR